MSLAYVNVGECRVIARWMEIGGKEVSGRNSEEVLSKRWI